MTRVEHQTGLGHVANGRLLHVSLPVGVAMLEFADAEGRSLLARQLHVTIGGHVVVRHVTTCEKWIQGVLSVRLPAVRAGDGPAAADACIL